MIALKTIPQHTGSCTTNYEFSPHQAGWQPGSGANRAERKEVAPLFAAGMRRLADSPRPFPLFVDSEPHLQYSGDLARCCAWGLCVHTRTRLVGALEGLAGTGHRLLDILCVQPSQSPNRANSSSPHPNRFVWQWVEIRPVRILRGQCCFVREFLRRPSV
jgi:hypothetical protein